MLTLHAVIQDFRFALRSLAASRGFTAAAILTLAIGMGATTIVFGIVDGLLLRPAPFGPRSARLVTLHSTHATQARDWDDSRLSYADLRDVGERSTTLEAIGGVISRNVSLSSDNEAERVRGASITPNLFELLQVRPQVGRAFRQDDAAPVGFESVAIISDGLWRRLYGGDTHVAGRTILMNGRTLTIVGVMPPRFAFPNETHIWLPYRADRHANRDGRNMFAIGLLREHTALQAARDDMARIAAHLETMYPQTNRGWGIHVMRIRDFYIRDTTRSAVTVMLAAVVLVLLVGCANVASLLIARGISRQRELTVRAALGAGRLRLVRLLLTESLVIAIAGGAVGLLLASWGLDALLASNPEPPPYWAKIGIDGRVFAVAGVLCGATALLCGLVPAVRVSRVQITSGALQSSRTSAAKGERRVQGVLVAAQVAVSFALLVAATLLTRSTMALQNADLGFDVRPLLSVRFYIAGDQYDDPAARARAVMRVVDAVRAVPGVLNAAATGAIPGDDGGGPLRLLPPRGVTTVGGEIGAQHIPVSPGLFDTLGLRMVEGRTFTSAETENPQADVAIVNRHLAEFLWPGQGAVGRQLHVVEPDGNLTLRVIGVVPNVVYEELGEQTAQSVFNVYLPQARAGWRSMALLVRAGDPSSVASAARRAIHDVDRSFAAFDVMTMEQRRAFTMWSERFFGRTFAAFALTALLLACIGAYGLTAYAALQRTREIGVRIAVGAARADIVRLLLARDGRLALAGMVVGLPIAIASATVLEKLLFQVSPWQPGVWMVTPIALLTAILTASFLPARRASNTDPAIALRAE